MILNSIYTLSSFPFEKIGIFLNNTAAPESSARIGIRFRDGYYNHGTFDSSYLINWNPSLKLKQSGLTPEIQSVPALAPFYNVGFNKSFVQPTNFGEIPSDFPLFFETSAIPYDYLYINFKGGTSGICVFPTQPYPVITKISNRQFSVSAGLLPLSACDFEVNKKEYLKSVNEASLQPLTNVSVNAPASFYSATKRDFLWKTVTTNPLVNNIFNNDIIPANLPYDSNIIPQSFKITFPISASNVTFPFDYTLCYAYTENGTHFLSGLGIESLINPIAKTATLDAAASRITATLNTGLTVPKGSRIMVSYETSAVTTSNVSVLGTNAYNVSTELPPYLYSHIFGLTGPDISARNAFTINFIPSAIQLPAPVTSAREVSTVFVDNFYQTHFPIQENRNTAIIKFSESTNDVTLSAFDKAANIVYTANTWIPASATLKFVNNGLANSHTVTLQLSTARNAIYDLEPFTFILNKDRALINVGLTGTTENSANAIGSIFPTYDPNLKVRWTVEPPENIRIIEKITGTTIANNSLVNANALDVNILNLGVDTTRVTLYSQEFDVSASTLWFPPSSIFANTTLAITGNINDFPKIKTSNISAVFVKQNRVYPVPQNAYITWEESLNDVRGVFFFRDNANNDMYENTVYPSIRNYTNIRPEMSTRFVEQNPQLIMFNVGATVFSDYYNYNTSRLFTAREYPSNANITAILSASNGQVIDTSETEATFFTSAVSITAVANTSDFTSISPSNISWTLPNGSIVTGLSTVFTLASTFCLGFSALSAKPAFGGFGYYDFSDEICLYKLNATPNNFTFLAIPEYQFFPKQQLSFADGSYTQSRGVSGFKTCDTQNFIISTFGGFDEYVYKLGNKVVRSTSNIETIPLTYANVSANGTIGVSGFNLLFRETDPATIYNSAQSDNSTVFKQHVNFVDVPTVSASLFVDNYNFDLRRKNTTYFNHIITYSPTEGIDLYNISFHYVLSSIDGIRFSDEFTATSNAPYALFSNFSFNPSSFFSIKENTFNAFNFFVSGNFMKRVNSFGCDVYQPFVSNIQSITAYDGPDLEIFTENHLHRTNETVYFSNETDASFPRLFDYFVFNDGNNNIQTVSSYNTPLTGFYTVEGVYSPSLTGVYLNDDDVSRTWTNYIIVKDDFVPYDSNILRQFPETLVLPYECKDVVIPPNAWQHETSINAAIEKIQTNFEFLSSMAFTYNINIPKYYIGWAGEKNGKFQWRYDNTYVNAPYYSSTISSIKDFIFFGDQIAMINGNAVELRTNDFSLSAVYSSANITEGEVFIDPTRIAYSAPLNKLIVLDKNRKSVYVFDVINNALVLSHFWGGVGERSSRTKLNNPTDLTTDSNGFIYIVDADSRIVKVYNQYLNWINMSLEHDEWTNTNRPISICQFEDTKYVLSENGTVYIFDEDSQSVGKFEATVGSRIYANEDNEGTLYIMADKVHAYAFNGVYLHTVINPNISNPQGMTFKDNESYIFTSSVIYKVIDFIETTTVKTDTYTPYIWNWDNLKIQENEPVTDYVFNDTFKKIKDNFYLLAKDLNKKFVVKIDEFDQFVYQTTSAISAHEIMLSALSYEPLGINELVTYETINRSIKDICADVELVREMLEVREERDYVDSNCWTWRSLKIGVPQNLNDNRRPYSWIELRRENSTLNPQTSSLTWVDLKSCAGETNSFPVCWTWETMTCDCLLNVSWEDLECNGLFGATWEQLESDCCKKPSEYFDDCITVC